MMPTFPKVGLDALLTPENCAVLLIDHQPSQLANVNSHDPTLVINNVGAIFTNVFIVPASPVIPLLLLLAPAAVAWARRHQLRIS